ncbi:ShlB/FhaC/HecB family hemolysin secretion/activation protein [Sporohalobacter salinus]|uniref:ShlB/FhaC/HecB family hemolysin secretion/activation protein n=1 Tax=Sporohalobacter salinus TaxID=1494606 RepID=UPI001961F5C2|nr:ShlB/FhaC/HecB family hemolysin secretion/activation protein [Sporohalobacter salinus]MBM7624510.1 hemolysin activation/secretion protein [Sporohalobacter salinus]
MTKKFYLVILVCIILSMSIISTNLYAKKQPNIGDVLKETEPDDKIEKKKKENEIPTIEEKPIKEPMKNLDGKKVLVKKIKVEGNHVISSDKLEKLVNTDEFVKKKLSLAEMEEAATVITKYYREQGYFVARAYIPKQEMKNDILTIAVIEGQYGKFKLTNDSFIKDSIVQAMLDSIKDENIISVNTIERAMLIINDTPGARVTQADVMPGEELGTSDFAITTKATKRFSGYVVADNYGGEYTGENRLSGAFNINSPFKLGDKLSVQSMLTDKSGIENYRLSYSLPLSASGLRGEVAYSDTEYELSEEYEDLDAVGSSENLELNFTYPVKRTRLSNIEAFVNLSKRDMVDEIRLIADKTEKEAESINTGISFTNNKRVYNWNSQTKVTFDFTVGDLDFEDAADKAEDEAGADTNGQYSKVNLSLQEKLRFNSKWSLDSSLECQYALNNKNLDGSEDLSIGGSNGVKLYPTSEHSAENGYLLNLELFYNLPDYKKVSSKVSLFYDLGRAYMADNTVGFEPRTLQDIGLGYYINYKDVFVNIHWAHKIDDEDVTSEDDYDDKLLFQTGFVF